MKIPVRLIENITEPENTPGKNTDRLSRNEKASFGKTETDLTYFNGIQFFCYFNHVNRFETASQSKNSEK